MKIKENASYKKNEELAEIIKKKINVCQMSREETRTTHEQQRHIETIRKRRTKT